MVERGRIGQFLKCSQTQKRERKKEPTARDLSLAKRVPKCVVVKMPLAHDRRGQNDWGDVVEVAAAFPTHINSLVVQNNCSFTVGRSGIWQHALGGKSVQLRKASDGERPRPTTRRALRGSSQRTRDDESHRGVSSALRR